MVHQDRKTSKGTDRVAPLPTFTSILCPCARTSFRQASMACAVNSKPSSVSSSSSNSCRETALEGDLRFTRLNILLNSSVCITCSIKAFTAVNYNNIFCAFTSNSSGTLELTCKSWSLKSGRSWFTVGLGESSASFFAFAVASRASFSAAVSGR